MAAPVTAHYVTSLDRIGLALGVGGALSGCVAAVLVALGGQADIASILIGWLIGSVAAMIALVAVAGPVWLALHLANRRGPWVAAATGGLLTLAIFSAGQSWGFGLFGAPASDSAAFAYRLASAVATSLIVALLAAGIALAMHRIAYRRLF